MGIEIYVLANHISKNDFPPIIAIQNISENCLTRIRWVEKRLSLRSILYLLLLPKLDNKNKLGYFYRKKGDNNFIF